MVAANIGQSGVVNVWEAKSPRSGIVGQGGEAFGKRSEEFVRVSAFEIGLGFTVDHAELMKFGGKVGHGFGTVRFESADVRKTDKLGKDGPLDLFTETGPFGRVLRGKGGAGGAHGVKKSLILEECEVSGKGFDKTVELAGVGRSRGGLAEEMGRLDGCGRIGCRRSKHGRHDAMREALNGVTET